MCHSWKNAPPFENEAALKNAAHLVNCKSLGKEQHPWEKAAHWGKCDTLGKKRHTWKNVPDLERCGTWKNAAYPVKCSTL